MSSRFNSTDWTVDPETGRANSSPLFRNLVAEVAEVIRNGAFTLLSGHAETVAGTIVANLAHVHGLQKPPFMAPSHHEELLGLEKEFQRLAYDGTTAQECALWQEAAGYVARAAVCLGVIEQLRKPKGEE